MSSTEAGPLAHNESGSEPPEPQGEPQTADTGAHTDDEDDRWRKFAQDQKPEPATETAAHAASKRRIRAELRRTGVILRHEWSLAIFAAILIAVVMTWPVMADPLHTIPHDLGDPLLISFVLGWTGHALWNNPGGIWDTSAFYPNTDTFAFTDTFLGYAPASMIGTGHEAALLRYNLLYVFAFALAFFGAYVLFRQLGARVAGSAVAAAAFAYAPWKLAQAGHLQVLSVGGIVLALAMLARGHGWSMRYGYRVKRTRWEWVAGGWLVATWQVSIGFGIGVPFGYFMAGIGVVAVIAWLLARMPRVPWRLLVANGVGILTFAGVSLALALPYFRVMENHPEAARSLADVDLFSPGWASFLISPPESSLWGEAHAPAREGLVAPAETTLLLGFTLIALTLVGLIWSCWTRRQRWFLGAGVGVTIALAMGTNFIDDGEWAYALLFNYLPGFDGLRTPGRLVLYTTLFMAILAAGTLTHMSERLTQYATEDHVDPRWKPSVPLPMRLALFIPAVLVLSEGASIAAVPAPPPPPVALAEIDDPMLVLPSDYHTDVLVQYWTVDGFPTIVNGTAAFTPTSQQAIRDDSLTFPSAPSVVALREAGIKTVVVVRDRIPGTPWENVLSWPISDPSITVVDQGAVVTFQL